MIPLETIDSTKNSRRRLPALSFLLRLTLCYITKSFFCRSAERANHACREYESHNLTPYLELVELLDRLSCSWEHTENVEADLREVLVFHAQQCNFVIRNVQSC